MPYVNIQITDDGVTREQKRALVAEVTQALVTILGKRPEHIHIVIEEVKPENWGYAGALTDEWRERQRS